MTAAHWSDWWLEWLRDIAPELDPWPFYLRSASEIPEGHRLPSALAWTGRNHDLRLRSVLESGGWWRGRGPAIVVADKWHQLDQGERAAILLHELGHVLDDGQSWRKPAEDLTFLEAAFAIPGGQEFMLAAFRPMAPALLSETAIDQFIHGHKFVRACLHLLHRSGGMVEPRHTLFVCQDYGTPRPLGEYQKGLADELRAGGDLFDILATPEPSEFATLFENQY